MHGKRAHCGDAARWARKSRRGPCQGACRGLADAPAFILASAINGAHSPENASFCSFERGAPRGFGRKNDGFGLGVNADTIKLPEGVLRVTKIWLEAKRLALSLPKQKRIWAVSAAAVLLLALVASQSVYIAKFSEYAVVSRFGAVKDVAIGRDSAGIKFKAPFIDNVRKYSALAQTFAFESRPVETKERLEYSLSEYVVWKIADPALFAQAFGKTARAEAYLESLVHPIMSEAVLKMDAEAFIGSANLNYAASVMAEELNKAASENGIEIIGVQAHRTETVPANLEMAYERMSAKYSADAEIAQIKAQNAYSAQAAKANHSAEAIRSQALAKAAEIQGAADAERARIYAESYNRDSSFAGFFMGMQALKDAVGSDTAIVLDESSAFLRYWNSPEGE
jgi:membrane protease subunit HflC